LKIIFSFRMIRNVRTSVSVRPEGVGNSDICFVTFLDPPPKKEAPVVVAKDAPVKEVQLGDEFADAMVSLQKDLGLLRS